MSDRREAVARALFERKRKEYDLTTRWEQLDEDDQEHLRNDADASLAAMDAEPTEAEIEAARHEYITKLDAFIEAAKANADCQCYSRDDYPECVERIYENAGHEAMRAALTAFLEARKARQ